MTNHIIARSQFFVKRYLGKTMSVVSICYGIDAVIDCLKGDEGLFGGCNFLAENLDNEVEKIRSVLALENFTSVSFGDKDFGFDITKD